jgi:hypothetical protein
LDVFGDPVADVRFAVLLDVLPDVLSVVSETAIEWVGRCVGIGFEARSLAENVEVELLVGFVGEADDRTTPRFADSVLDAASEVPIPERFDHVPDGFGPGLPGVVSTLRTGLLGEGILAPVFRRLLK